MIFKMKNLLITFFVVSFTSACTFTIPLTSDGSLVQPIEQKTDSELRKEEALNTQKVKAEQKAKQAEEKQNEKEAEQQPSKGDGGGGNL